MNPTVAAICSTSPIAWLTKTPTVSTWGGSSLTILRARRTEIERGVPGTMMKPSMSAPSSTATIAVSIAVLPQTLTRIRT